MNSTAHSIEQITLNLMEDVWSSLHLSPEAVIESSPFGTHGIYIQLVDKDEPALRYYLDNGWDCLPDGMGLRARHGAVEGPVVWQIQGLPGDASTWQQKAVEPLVVALRDHMSIVRKSK